jgi:hypothetical protein
MKINNMSGKRFFNLLVVSRIGTNKHKEIMWTCLCDCGKECISTGYRLRNGHTKSCGCRRWASRLLGDEPSFNSFMSSYKQNAKNRNRSFSLSKEEFRLVTSRLCRYCGSEPTPFFAPNRTTVTVAPYLCNGIDREDNSKGYDFENCVPCCRQCNFMKNDAPVEIFIEQIKKISAHMEL